MANILKYVFLAGLILAEVIRFPQRARVSRARRAGQVSVSQVKGSETLWMSLSFLGMYVLPLIYIFSNWLDFANYSLPVWAGVLGILFLILALYINWRAQVDLGKSWSPSLEVTEGLKLVTGGIYSVLRHPIYTAMLLLSAAQVLLLHNWIAGLLGALSFLPIYITRIPREEQMMLEQFGDQYRAYMQRTHRVLPKIFR